MQVLRSALTTLSSEIFKKERRKVDASALVKNVHFVPAENRFLGYYMGRPFGGGRRSRATLIPVRGKPFDRGIPDLSVGRSGISTQLSSV